MSSLSPSQALIIAASAKHTATVIFVHGLGDSGLGWPRTIVEHCRKIAHGRLDHVKWILPHAPPREITVNLGARMPAWFNITSTDLNAGHDEEGMLQSMRFLDSLIASEVDNGIASTRIILGGFSQGGTMSLLTGLCSQHPLAGIVILSGRVVLKEKLKSMCGPHAKTTPIFWGHGTHDPLVRYEWGVQSVDFLKADLGVPESAGLSESPPSGLVFRSYNDLNHSVDEVELQELQEWMVKALPGHMHVRLMLKSISRLLGLSTVKSEL